ncbi:hypothetical protein EC957_007358 [Mortierella hygrophila]|uniref:Uncharacterized protein n=1 Tax=Mortierella hygrophila TaxID=979708 RepID=A0A9P6K630_9FUNG|nr:hypothetical protein EC957_007358 [Mortierella hygrophila]
MLAKTNLVALTVALALLAASLGPTPVTGLPVADNNNNNNCKNDNNNDYNDQYNEYTSFVLPARTTTRPPPVPHFNLPIPSPPSTSPYPYYYGDDDYGPSSPSPSPYPYNYGDDDYGPSPPELYYGDDDYAPSYQPNVYFNPSTPVKPTRPVWDGITTGFHYPTASGGGGGQAMPTWATRAPRFPHPPRVTSVHWYGHGGGAVYSRTMSAGGPIPTRTPYRYNGGNDGGAQQRPFGVDQQHSTQFQSEPSTYNDYDEYAPIIDPPLPFDDFEGDDGYCRPSGQMKRYIGVDLREDSFAVGYVNSAGKIVLIPNEKGEVYSPTSVRFIDGGRQALVGLAALHSDVDQGLTTKQLEASAVDMTSLNSNKTFPQNVRLNLERYLVTYYDDREMWSEHGVSQRDLLAVVLKRAMDMAEGHKSFSSRSGEKVDGVVLTVQNHSNDAEDASCVYERDITDWLSRMTPVAEIVDSYPETLSLAAAHIKFFESKVQPDPLGGENTYLPQTVLFYNLRDTTEDMTLMRYHKGTFGLRPFHLQFLGGYLPHEDGLIQDEFERYLLKILVHRFNRAWRKAPGSHDFVAFLEDNEIQHVNKTEFRLAVELMDRHSKASNSDTDEDWRIYTELKFGPQEMNSPRGSMMVTLSMYKEVRFEFMKERLSKAVNMILASSGLESKDMVDHLVVADMTLFKGQSTAAMAAVFGKEGEKKIVKAVDSQRAVAEGIVAIAGLLTKESPLQVPWYCPDHQP